MYNFEMAAFYNFNERKLMNNNNRSWGGRGPGGMEQQIILWIADFKKWVYSHERFSWITFFLAVIPSPTVCVNLFVAFC